MDSMSGVDHDLVIVEEFDALSIEVKLPRSSGEAPVTFSALSEKLGKYPAKTHARKVAKELDVKTGLIYLPGVPTRLYEDSDMNPEFRQRRYFYYLSGLNFADCAVTYDIAKDNLTLWIPYSDPKKVLWFGTTPGPEECRAKSDVDNVRYVSTLERSLYVYCKLNPAAPIYVLHEDQTPRLALFAGKVHVDTAKLQPAMDEARVCKSEYEVAMIRQANKISSEAHTQVMRHIRNLSSEREIDAIFRGYCTAHGADRQAYPVIAGSGTNAATLHYWQNDQPLAGKQMVVLDAGAEWNVYASDVTRAIPIGGRFTPEGAAIYAAVRRMQEECIARVRPGIVFYTLHVHATMIAIGELLKLGILHGGSAKDIFARGTASAFFPHGLGHHIGLEVHDVTGKEALMFAENPGAPSYTAPGAGRRPKRERVTPQMQARLFREAMSAPPPHAGRRQLAKNMIVTIEPGIYFCREYIEAYYLSEPEHAKYINKEVLETYYPVGGVRLEDCVLVTEDGHEDLTTAPMGEEMLKIINGE